MHKVGGSVDAVITGSDMEVRMDAFAWLGIDIAKDTFEACLLQEKRAGAPNLDG
jgi:hypothetical protein